MMLLVTLCGAGKPLAFDLAPVAGGAPNDTGADKSCTLIARCNNLLSVKNFA
jgi:hypothetical protein